MHYSSFNDNEFLVFILSYCVLLSHLRIINLIRPSLQYIILNLFFPTRG